MPGSDEPIFFETPTAFRAWLERHHADHAELIVGFHKRATGKPSLTWSEAVDEALCFGWIDGVRRTYDATSYTIRFTPRTSRSTWSAINVAKVEALIREGLMKPAGLAAFEQRDLARTAIYSHEQRDAARLEPAMERRFRADRAAWTWFEGQAPSYRKTAIHWVTSAKKPETRERRLDRLIE
ncbi:MAG TPA: YdeI/OmpD-associated family protein, partial [Actinomycetota bacterium]